MVRFKAGHKEETFDSKVLEFKTRLGGFEWTES